MIDIFTRVWDGYFSLPIEVAEATMLMMMTTIFNRERSEDFSHLFYIFHRSVIINNHLFQREKILSMATETIEFRILLSLSRYLAKVADARWISANFKCCLIWMIYLNGHGQWMWLKIEVWMNWMVETFTSNWYLQECGRKSSLTKLKITFRVEWNRWICSKFFQTEKLFCHVFTSHLPTRCLASF